MANGNRPSKHINDALITFFEMRGSAQPERDAGETLNRMAGEYDDFSALPASQFYQAARGVLQEKTAAKTTGLRPARGRVA